MYAADPSVFVTDRSALLDCVSVSVALLFPGVGSVTPDGAAMVATFTRFPVRLDGTGVVTMYVIEPPTGRFTVSAIAPDPAVLPLAPPDATAVHDAVLIPVGSGSDT